jgi:ABC-type branched-subunit amino acid transport system ATPase component
LLLVEQKPEETLGLADRAAILETGEIVYDGRPDRLLDDDELLRTHIGVVK